MFTDDDESPDHEEDSDSEEEIEFELNTPDLMCSSVSPFGTSSPVIGYRILSPEQVQNEIGRVVESISDVLQVDFSTSIALLRHYDYDPLNCEQHFLAASEEEKIKVLESTGISLDSIVKRPFASLECPICFCEWDPDDLFAMSCGHFYCRFCWSQFLETSVQSDGWVGCLSKTCPYSDPKCVLVVHERVWRELASSQVYEKYKQHMLRSFVLDNPRYRFCPAPGCDFVIASEKPLLLDVNCKCGHNFCFECGEESHVPASCRDVRNWQKRESDDGSTAEWMKAHNVKHCPKCSAPIEKNDGCMTMSCASCHYSFCWACLGPAHGHFSSESGCNRWVPDEKHENDRQAALESLQRFKHYYTRYMNHRQSQKFEEGIQTQVERLCDFLPKDAVYASHRSTITHAATILLRCRHVLKWSYVYAYYEDDDKIRSLFEFQQDVLEEVVENLAELFREPYDRQKFVLRTSAAQHQLQVIAEGTEQRREFMESSLRSEWKSDMIDQYG